ncbi:hypothetical protein N0V87_008738 [Didymella glomerata]|uniref:Uncharacterized protein n=1 Tax=Didymella glomerata TaxID=749621 RepID=A0A9W8WSI1_9PLEO|nr:hypothetical protein N0V87_008738 [Didymella glomerata]
MNDGNFGQYWITKPINTFKSYIKLGLKGGYLATGPSPFLFHYDTPSKSFRCDRFVQYMRASGLPFEDAKELERYLDSTTANKKFDIEQAKAFASRCGMDRVLNLFFRACQDLKVEVSCLLCDPASGSGILPYDRCNGNRHHFFSYHGINCGNAVGRCHFPGCPVIFLVTDDKKVNKVRDAHLLECDRRHLLFPNEHYSV